MKEEIKKVLPAIRMLASKKIRVSATFIPGTSDSADKLIAKGICSDRRTVLELHAGDTDISSLQKYFTAWFSMHDRPPSFVALQDIGSISISVPTDPDKSFISMERISCLPT
jgi:hypothetical protein